MSPRRNALFAFKMESRKKIPRSALLRYGRAWCDHLEREYKKKRSMAFSNARKMLATVEPEYRCDLGKRIYVLLRRMKESERASADKQLRKALKDFAAQYEMGLLDDVDVSE